MFFKKLYQHSKLLFLIFVSFLFAFVFLNYKWGVVATPVYQYGMYSGPMYLRDTLHLMQVNINGKKLNMGKYTFASKDKMLVMPDKYLKSLHQNKAIQQSLQRIFTPLGMWSLFNSDKFVQQVQPQIFMQWYRNQLQRFIHEEINSIEILQQDYLRQATHLVPLATPQKIDGLAYP
jgi:hypothetical protein